jgi:hypothetical protein
MKYLIADFVCQRWWGRCFGGSAFDELNGGFFHVEVFSTMGARIHEIPKSGLLFRICLVVYDQLSEFDKLFTK